MLKDACVLSAAEFYSHALERMCSANKGRLSAFSSGARVGDALVWIREVGAWLGFCCHVISQVSQLSRWESATGTFSMYPHPYSRRMHMNALLGCGSPT